MISHLFESIIFCDWAPHLSTKNKGLFKILLILFIERLARMFMLSENWEDVPNQVEMEPGGKPFLISG